MALKNNRAPLLSNIKLYVSFHNHIWIQTGVTVRKRLSWVVTSVTLTFDLWPWSFARTLPWSLVITPENFMMIRWWEHSQQGKSEGFESCDRPIVWKRPIWVKIGDVLYRVTLKFDGWPCKTIGHFFYSTPSFMHHFGAIGVLKLELESGNAQFGSNSTIFRAVWPWNLTDDLEKQ